MPDKDLSPAEAGDRIAYGILVAALEEGLVRTLRDAVNVLKRFPVKGTSKFKEAEGRTLYLTPEAETSIRDQLGPDATATGRPTLDARRGDLRPLFSVSIHTGLRWSEQCRLEWRDADLLMGVLTVRQSKSGHSRQIPMNSVVRSALVDLASQRREPDNPEEPVFRVPYRQPGRFFPKA